MCGSRNFCQGGGGGKGGGQTWLPENSSDNFFVFSPQPFLQFYSGL